MPARFSILQIGKVLFAPGEVFSAVAAESPPAGRVFFRGALWLGLLPPLFAYFGTMKFGWRLGVEPVYLPKETVLAICVTYFENRRSFHSWKRLDILRPSYYD